MQQKYFIDPFAVSGDITPAIPDPSDPSGFVSYTDGFTFDYQRDLITDPAAKSIDRVTVNRVLNDITTNVQDYQQNGTPEFISSSDNGGSAFSYRIGAMVRYSSGGTAPFVTYINTIDHNTNLPTASLSGWFPIGRTVHAFPTSTATLTGNTSITKDFDGTFIKINAAATTQTLVSTAGVSGMSVGFYAAGTSFVLASAAGSIIGEAINLTSMTVPANSFICLQSDGTNWKIFSASPSVLSGKWGSSQVFTTSGNFTWPQGVDTVKVTVIGAGGAGGSTGATGNQGAAGGSAGGTAIRWIKGVTPGTVTVVTCGALGTPGTFGNPGNNGGSSSFGAFCSATGGQGGSASNTATAAGNPSGVGSGGDLNVNGGSGGDGQTFGGAVGGMGGNSILAGGGRGGTLSNAATMRGQAYGAGGGGAYFSVNIQGGQGSPGLVIVEW